MKLFPSLIRGFVFGLAGLAGLAVAATTYRSIQLSQDTTGLYTVDSDHNLNLNGATITTGGLTSTGALTGTSATFSTGLVGTTTNDSAATGYVGEYKTSGLCAGSASTATVTITIAAPGVITDTGHGITGACPVVLTTTGALPTGLTASTTYWVVPSSITANTYSLATTVANALAGTMITTSGTQSGTQTRTSGNPLTSTSAANITGVALTAGDWDCGGVGFRTLAASTSVTKMITGVNTTSATQPTEGSDAGVYFSTAANVMGANTDFGVGPSRVSLSAAGNVYLVATDTFTVSTNIAGGTLSCRRIR